MKLLIEKEFVAEECITCGVIFGISSDLRYHIKEAKRPFFCPNGHSMSYTVSEADKLRKEIASRDGIIRDQDAIIKKLKNPKAKKTPTK